MFFNIEFFISFEKQERMGLQSPYSLNQSPFDYVGYIK